MVLGCFGNNVNIQIGVDHKITISRTSGGVK